MGMRRFLGAEMLQLLGRSWLHADTAVLHLLVLHSAAGLTALILAALLGAFLEAAATTAAAAATPPTAAFALPLALAALAGAGTLALGIGLLFLRRGAHLHGRFARGRRGSL